MFNHIKLMGRPGSDGNGGVEREEGMQDLIYLFFQQSLFISSKVLHVNMEGVH